MPHEETPKAAAAFTEYCLLGIERSLAKLAAKLGKPSGYTRHLESWSSKYDWQERIKAYDKEQIEREAEIKRQAREKAIEDMNERHIQIALNMQYKLVQRISELMAASQFDARVSISALKLATDLERLARGEPIQTTKLEHSGSIDMNGARESLINKLSAFARHSDEQTSDA